MDLLSQRYASPFFVLDEFIHLEQLHAFVNEICTVIIDERKEKYRWEFYLHKVFDMSYDEFLHGVHEEENEEMTDEEIIDVVDDSMALIDLF